MEGEMRRKAHSAAQQDAALTKRYKKIGISAVAAAARYQRNEKSKKPGARRPKDGDTSSFRGTSPRRRY
jgi:hypothetical protein